MPGVLVLFLLALLLVGVVLAVFLIIFLLLFHRFIPLVFLIKKIIEKILLISFIAIFYILITIFILIVITVLTLSLILLLLPIPLIISIETRISSLLFILTTNTRSYCIIIFSYLRITQNPISIRDFFKFFICFTLIFIRVVFLGQFIIGFLDILFLRARSYT